MDHYDMAQWVDHARGLVDGRRRKLMQAHLASGCRKCRRTLEILQEMAAISGAEAQFQVPEHVVRSARAIYALQRPEGTGSLRRIIGRLIYDSFREPLPAGIRAHHRVTRQALYKAGDYSLDLRLERQPGTTRVNLVGQIANEKEPGKPPSHQPVFLLWRRDILAHAFSNTFGEFQLEYEPVRDLRLCIQADQSLIEVLLDRVMEKLPGFNRGAPDSKNKTS
jgi:hypothetical protein